MAILALIGGFCMGAGCSCALLFLLKKAAPMLDIGEKPVKFEPEPENEADRHKIPEEKQLEALLNYDGKPKKREQVNEDEG